MPRRWQKLRWKVLTYYWQIVKRVDLKAYLQHQVDITHEDDQWEPEQDLACHETREYQKRARRVHVTIAAAIQPDQKECWLRSYDGDQFLESQTLARFKTLVEAAEYERDKRGREKKEMLVKYFTALAATIAAIASVYTPFVKK